jgi:hypothetical protein
MTDDDRIAEAMRLADQYAAAYRWSIRPAIDEERAALEAHLRAALVEATRQPATESDPAPHPGQLWHFSDWHHGNVLGVVEGTGDRDVWHITTFTWFRDCWIKGYRNALFGPADFKRDGVTYVGTLPPPKEWHCAAAVRSLAENGDG